MNDPAVISLLEREWDFETGFFGLLRRGEFRVDCLRRLLTVLESTDLSDGVTINRRIVSLLWFMPLFMEWQRERIHQQGGDTEALGKAINQVHCNVERLLGVP